MKSFGNFDPDTPQSIRLAPYSAQSLRRAGINVIEFPQSLPNLSAVASNLFELVRSRTLAVFPDADLPRAAAQAIAIESARGWKIDKARQSQKIDPLIALGMAALAAVQGTQNNDVLITDLFGSHVYFDSHWPGGVRPRADREPISEQVRFAQIWPGEIATRRQRRRDLERADEIEARGREGRERETIDRGES